MAKNVKAIQDDKCATWLAIKIARRLMFIDEYKEENKPETEDIVDMYQKEIKEYTKQLRNTGCR